MLAFFFVLRQGFGIPSENGKEKSENGKLNFTTQPPVHISVVIKWYARVSLTNVFPQIGYKWDTDGI